MSSKVAVQPYLPKWRDAVSLGTLDLMINALYGLGYDLDTPVTLLYDEDHVWLETIDDE